jgi:polysaccharide biosynthesis/export protein
MMRSWFMRLIAAALTLATAAPAGAQSPAPKPAAVIPAAPTAVASSPDYVIGVDDLLHIIVWDNKELEQQVSVRPDGKISFPLAGELQAAGRTVPQLTTDLTERLSKSVKNPNVSVMVKEIHSFRVYFVGKISKPGVYPIKAGTPFLQALTLAGGPAEGADLPASYIIRGKEKIPVDLRRLIQDGDLSKNLDLQTEDTVVVPEITLGTNPQELLERRVYLLGKVSKPGVYSIKSEVPVLHAVFLGGGIAEGADAASSFIMRDGHKIPVDLWRLIQKGDVSQNVMVKPEDTLVIPEGGEVSTAVFIMGEVAKPGPYPKAETLSILKLVTLAGGFTKFAASNRATLIRQDGDKKILKKINLNDIIDDPAKYEDFAMRPGDVVIVPQKLF